MKFIVGMKSGDAIEIAVDGMAPEDEKVAREFAAGWMEWGEYLHVEFDTAAGTARVLRVDEDVDDGEEVSPPGPRPPDG